MLIKITSTFGLSVPQSLAPSLIFSFWMIALYWEDLVDGDFVRILPFSLMMEQRFGL